MTFLEQFGINKHFKRPQMLIFEKFSRANLFQIALEIMWLPILILLHTLNCQLKCCFL